MDSRDCDEREIEMDGMQIEIDGLVIEIPEHLVQERMELIGISREEVQEMLKDDLKTYKDCLVLNRMYNSANFEQKFVAYLDGELAMYRL